MGLFDSVRRMVKGTGPTVVDYEAYAEQPVTLQSTGTFDSRPAVLRKLGPGGVVTEPGTYKLQQSYDSLLETVQALRSSLDGQARRQEELLTRLSTLPHAVETLPQTSKMQNDMLKVINDRLALHADQQKKLADVMTDLGSSKKEEGGALQAIREQIETGNEIDRQLVESFNRFSMMIDRLHLSNNHAVDCLQQVRDSYAVSQMQMQEWIEKSRQKSTWVLGASFVFSVLALGAVVVLLVMLFHAPR